VHVRRQRRQEDQPDVERHGERDPDVEPDHPPHAEQEACTRQEQREWHCDALEEERAGTDHRARAARQQPVQAAHERLARR